MELQRWEYLFVGKDGPAYKARYVNGEELRDWKRGPSFPAFVNELGDQGWELLGSDFATGLYVFKRPKT